MKDALKGVRVIEMAFYYPGPFAGLVLSDLGAEVVKVESPDGDPMRPVGARANETMGPGFRVLNRGKKSVVIDLKTEAGKQDFLALVRTADVLLQVLRPDAMGRLGLGRDRLAAENPRLVHCLLTGYGATGPWANRAGHDIDYAAMSGVLGLTGAPGGDLAMPGVQIGDLCGALCALVDILAAIRERDATGKGRFLDVSITEAALLSNTFNLSGSWLPGDEARPGGFLLSGRMPGYNIYRARDGKWFALGAIEPKFWVGFCRAAGREDLMPRQMDPSAVEEVRALFATRDSADWRRLSEENDVCLEPAIGLDEIRTHPLHAAREALRTDASGATHVRFTGMDPPGPDRESAPELGQHTAEVIGRIR